MYPEGGYKTQSVTQIVNLIHAYDDGNISVKALRVYFAALCAIASREAAGRARTKRKGRGRAIPTYQLKELATLAGLTIRATSSEVRALERAGILRFSVSKITITDTAIVGSLDLCVALAGGRSKARPVPLPRPVLRFLARCHKASLIKTTLAYLVRGLTLARSGGEVTGKGSVKASWIAEIMGISERSARSGRAELISLGWISADEGSTQLKLNRTGAYFEINLSWKGEAKNRKRVLHTEASEGAIKSPVAEESVLPACEASAPKAVENSLSIVSEFAPPSVQNCTNFAPPYKDKKTSSYEESKNQKAQSSEPTGVFKKGWGREKVWDVRTVDLFHFGKVEALYFEACELGLVQACEASALNFLAAAIRARSIEHGEPARVFAGIIRRKLWHHVTQAEEDQARAALNRYREQNSERFRFQALEEAA